MRTRRRGSGASAACHGTANSGSSRAKLPCRAMPGGAVVLMLPTIRREVAGGSPWATLEVIEQITYLLFVRRLDDLHTVKENKARAIREPLEDPIFLPGQQHVRWSRFKNEDPGVMFRTIDEEVFPLLRRLGADGSTFIHLDVSDEAVRDSSAVR